MKNCVDKIKAMKVDRRYDADTVNIMEIVNAYKEPFSLCYAGFKYGYMQGMKAEKAKERKAQNV